MFLITVQFVAGVGPELGFASNYSSFQSKDRDGIRVCFSLWFNLTQRGGGGGGWVELVSNYNSFRGRE